MAGCLQSDPLRALAMGVPTIVLVVIVLLLAAVIVTLLRDYGRGE